ncbi:hypothetical protein U9M48_035680 [Paspalum notatum var. saurae]|uniref:Uncharacterized protein n=1 Tax=Paspalum notatum var. saurae TaxID=547442 RepID=A0AAQ3UD48_PASNO
MEKAQGLQWLDGVEPPMGHHGLLIRRHRRQWLHELAVGAGGGGFAEHDEEVAVGARHSHHVASGACGLLSPLVLVGSCGSSPAGTAAVDDGSGRGDVEVQVHALLPGPDPTLLQRLPVECFLFFPELPSDSDEELLAPGSMAGRVAAAKPSHAGPSDSSGCSSILFPRFRLRLRAASSWWNFFTLRNSVIMVVAGRHHESTTRALFIRG